MERYIKQSTEERLQRYGSMLLNDELAEKAFIDHVLDELIEESEGSEAGPHLKAYRAMLFEGVPSDLPILLAMVAGETANKEEE